MPALPEEEMLRLEADINGPLLAEEASRLGALKGDVHAGTSLLVADLRWLNADTPPLIGG